MPFTAFDTLALRAMIAPMSHKALRVYVLLATYADRTGICWPGIAELVNKSGLHTESVMDALEELERAGLMVYARRNERDPVTRKQLVNVYEIRGCLVKADSVSDSAFEHDGQTTNEITNDNNQFHQNHLQAPPPSTNEPRSEEQKQGPNASTMRNGEEKGEGQPRKRSAAGTAPQNSKADLPPLPPLPRGFKPDEVLPDEDDELAARWMIDQAMIRRDGGEYRATLSMANARRYIARYGRLKCRAAVALAKRDKETKSLIGRADYLLRTSVSEEAQSLQNEMDQMNQDSAINGD